jgi:hypothetical protein
MDENGGQSQFLFENPLAFSIVIPGLAPYSTDAKQWTQCFGLDLHGNSRSGKLLSAFNH